MSYERLVIAPACLGLVGAHIPRTSARRADGVWSAEAVAAAALNDAWQYGG